MILRNCFLAGVLITATLVTPAYSRTNADAEIKSSLDHLVTAVNARDIDGIMEFYVSDESLLIYDAILPRKYVGATALRKNWKGFLAAYPTTMHAAVSDWKIEAEGSLGYGHGLFRVTGVDKDGKPLDITTRVTYVFKKINGKWLAVHEHGSWPVDWATGKADFNSKP